MRSLFTAIVCLAVLMFSCEQPDEAEVTSSSKVPRTKTADAIAPSAPGPTVKLPTAPVPTSIEGTTWTEENLADRFHHIADEELPKLMDTIAAHEDAAQRQTLLTTIYEESDLRPDSTRLPLLLEVARSQDVNPDVRATIMGELAATLQTDHGASWGDWSLAMEEYLAENYGILRVE